MTEIFTNLELPPPFPDRTQLPEEDGTFGKNFQEHPQSIILTDLLGPNTARLSIFCLCRGEANGAENLKFES